jgi:hypothetical protein
MPQFTFTGSETLVFPTLPAEDGSTLICNPGDVVTLDTDPQIDLFVPVAAKAAPVPAPTPVAAPAEAPETTPEAPTTPAPAA